VNPQIKQLWVDALRSGEYPQTIGTLRSPDGFCCLGVLCQLAADAGIVTVQELGNGRNHIYIDPAGGLPAEAVLNNAACAWAGLEGAHRWDPEIASRRTNLASINDGGATFTEIADLIEAEL
jgi:hypothetical protein